MNDREYGSGLGEIEHGAWNSNRGLRKEACWLIFSHCDKIPEYINLKEGLKTPNIFFSFAYSSGFGPLLK